MQNKHIVEAHKLKQKKYRLANQRFLVEGEHLVEEAYKAGVLLQVFYTKELAFSDIESYQVNDKILDKLSDVLSNQGMIGVCQIQTKKKNDEKVLLLDGLQDPGNMGTLIRSAIAFGFETMVLDRCVDIYNPKVIRATQGAIFKVNFINHDIISYIEAKPNKLFIATSLDTNKYLSHLVLEENNIGLILGNEGSGVREEVIQKADKVVKLKMQNMESLNVGVAGSILMYELGGDRE